MRSIPFGERKRGHRRARADQRTGPMTHAHRAPTMRNMAWASARVRPKARHCRASAAIAAAAQKTRIPAKSANTIARELTMTAITGHIAPEAKDGDLGVHSLDQFVLQVPDASKAVDFYGNFGLDVRRDGNVLAIKTFGHDHRWGSVVEGAQKKALHHLSFG